MRKFKPLRASVAVLGAVGVFIACSAESCDPTSSQQQKAQQTTDSYQQAATQAVPYPLNQMQAGGWTERKLLQENLLRQNDPNAVHWVYLMTPQGQLVAQWTVRGMVFSPNSQMTNTQSITWSSNGSSGVVEAPGDNGTYGPEAFCYAFFTTSGVETKLPCNGMVPIESDAPLGLTDKPLITYNVDAKPSVDHGGLAGIGGKK